MTPLPETGEPSPWAGRPGLRAGEPGLRAGEPGLRAGEPSTSLSDYRFEFPDSLVAAAPAKPRDSSRLLVLDRRRESLEHRAFSDLPQYLRSGDCLVLNRSKVLPVRLEGRKSTGGLVQLTLVRELEPGTWSALSSDLKPGNSLIFPARFTAAVESLSAEGEWILRFNNPGVRELLAKRGKPPLPPYILARRKKLYQPRARKEDIAAYQTVYAREEGSIAAPTAGLHFTPELLGKIADQGVLVAELTLHVGVGTFRPVNAEDIREHRMLPEAYEITESAAEAFAARVLRGGRLIAVGTTTTRTLESFDSRPVCSRGSTDLFIRPGHRFRNVSALVTNFHQPASTPLLLACAFAGRERLLAAYREAIARQYRLFSYGDAMLIL